jgi:hypothetical protein
MRQSSTGAFLRRALRVGRRSGFTQVDLYVSIALTVLLVAYLIAPVARVREYGWPSHCQSNLKQIGYAMLLYANDNNGHFPRTTYDPSDPVARAYTGSAAGNPFSPNGPQPNDVTAAFYLLLRTQDLNPGVFICPKTKFRTPWDYGGAGRTVLDNSNFPAEKYLSYSITNPYPSTATAKMGFIWTNNLKADFAIAGDMNPGTPALMTLTLSSAISAVTAANNRNHPNFQNVLFGDLHVEDQQSSFCGVDQDNIYGPGGLIAAGPNAGKIDPVIRGSLYSSPRHKDDSVLLPVATLDPGTRQPTKFDEFWISGLPPKIVGWSMFAVVTGWLTFRWLWPAMQKGYRAIRRNTPEQRRIRRGLCAKCGYDLRASPTRCPECGYDVQSTTAQQAG